MKFFIGVDGGGTTTRAVVVDERQEVLGRAQSGSSNLYNLGLETALQHIRVAVEGAVAGAGLRLNQIESYGFGLAGIVGSHEKTLWQTALRAHYGDNLAVDEDVAAALVGAFGPDELQVGGAVLIAGTGANCFGRSADGRRGRADGWGPLLGDRGSGYWLGESAMRAALAAHDGAGPKTLLQGAVLQHFEVETCSALVSVVYAADFRRDRIAAFTTRVLQAARDGDEVARDLLRAAGEQLGATAQAVLRPLGIARLALTGGLLENAPEAQAAVNAFLNPTDAPGPAITICAPRFEAVVGAALLPLVTYEN